jgi:hypothetical protein
LVTTDSPRRKIVVVHLHVITFTNNNNRSSPVRFFLTFFYHALERAEQRYAEAASRLSSFAFFFLRV